MGIFLSFRVLFLSLLLFCTSAQYVSASTPTVDVPISSAGIIEGFSVACAGTNATALLLHIDYAASQPFNASIREYMRRPCVEGTVTFDAFNVSEYLVSQGGEYPAWTQYYRVSFTLVVKDTTDVAAFDAPLYQQIINLTSGANNFNQSVMGPDDTTYETLAVGPQFTFDGNAWFVVPPPPPPPPPEPIGDPNNLPVTISSGGDVSRVSIHCTVGHDYTLSLVHRDGDTVSYSFGVLNRQYCADGIVSFDGFNINTVLSTVDASWWNYVRTPLEYIIKDTTGVYSCTIYTCPLVNLVGQTYNYSFYLASSTQWTTVGKGPIFDTLDHSTWFDVRAGDESEGDCVSNCVSNILFLPGIQASRLYTKDEDGDEDRLWEPHGNQDIRQFVMTEEGESVESIYTRDVIDAAYGVRGVYNKFSAFMDGLASQEIIKEWKPFAYDWRYGVVDIAHNGTQYEDAIHDAVKEIEALKEDSFSEKVTIVAHSNGGLLAKAILTRLEQEGKANLVDKVILLASPQLGTPKAIGVLLHGYDQEQAYGLLMDDAEIRTVAKNMPGVYGLLPSQKYFGKSGSVPVMFGAGASTQVFTNAYGATIDNTAELTEFMVGTTDGRPDATEIYEASRAQRSMLENAFSDHNTILDTWVAPEGVEVIEVVGIGLNTVHQFKYEQFMERKCLFCARESIYKPVPQFSPYGDETVMGYSAEGYEGDKQTFYVDLGRLENENNPEAVEHADFGNNKSIQILVRNILTADSSTTPFIDTIRPSFSGTSYTILSTHSPVSLEIIDSEGHRVGKGASVPQTDIPGSTYMEVAGSTYIIVPQGTEYDVSIKGTGYGSMTFVTESLTGDTQTRLSVAEVATITPSTTIAISVSENTFSNLMVDTNGDTVVDQELTVHGEVVVPKGTYVELRNTIKALPAYYGYKQYLLALTNLAERFDNKSLTKVRFAKFEARILVRIKQILMYAVKKKQLTQAQIAPVLKVINDLK